MDYGLIGEKLGHSRSPEIHKIIGELRGEPYEYELREVAPCEVLNFTSMAPFKGINITIPYKRTVMEMLDEIDGLAARIGSVNTIVRREGRLYGYNTDYIGFARLAQRTGVSFDGARVLVLGSGGTCLTASAVAGDGGAADITVVSRKGPVTYDDIARFYDKTDIIINTTPVGMYPDVDGCPLDISYFTGLKAVLDVIYNPPETKLVAQAREMGIPAANGLYMLTSQAVAAAELFFNEKYNDDLYEEVYRRVSQNGKSL